QERDPRGREPPAPLAGQQTNHLATDCNWSSAVHFLVRPPVAACAAAWTECALPPTEARPVLIRPRPSSPGHTVPGALSSRRRTTTGDRSTRSHALLSLLSFH